MDPALSSAWAALQAGQWAQVLTHLEGVTYADPLLMARVFAWRAQSLDALGRRTEAEAAILAAIRSAKAGGDADGVRALREVQARILASLAAEQVAEAERAKDRALVDQPIAEVLSGATGGERAARLVRLANGLWEVGRHEEARQRAMEACTEARAAHDPREEVLARLSLARMDTPAPHILAAWAVADQANDPNLITAVAHAAKAAGVRLVAPGF